MIDNPFSKKRYFVALRFKNEKRAPVDCIMPVPEYRRMIHDYQKGKATGTYQMWLDNNEAELTFPLQEIDTVHAIPEVKDDKPSSKVN